jgi:uncharacterized protein YeaO (DUF488 family)
VNGKGREVADLDVVLKKEHPLVLILSSPSHHCRNHPQHTYTTFMSVYIKWERFSAKLSCNVSERKEREIADLEVVLKKEHSLVLALSSHSHHCKS